MPIVAQVEKKIVFDRLYIDTSNATATVYFSMFKDGVKTGSDIVHQCGPELVVPLLMVPAKRPELSRSFDIALAVYELAIEQNWFSGTIV
jgi:hypothetical protein